MFNVQGDVQFCYTGNTGIVQSPDDGSEAGCVCLHSARQCTQNSNTPAIESNQDNQVCIEFGVCELSLSSLTSRWALGQ